MQEIAFAVLYGFQSFLGEHAPGPPRMTPAYGARTLPSRNDDPGYATAPDQGLFKNNTHLTPVEVVLNTLNCKLTSL